MGSNEIVPFRAGEIITAEVLSLGESNSATVRLKNAVLEVHSYVPLQKGATLTLRVERQENAAYLRLGRNAVDQPVESVQGTLQTALSSFDRLKPGTEAVLRLAGLLSKLPEALRQNLPEIDIVGRFLPQIDTLSGNSLKDGVQNGGIFFETKLRILALGLESDNGADIEAGRIITNDLKASCLRLKDAFLAPAVLEHLRSSVIPDELLGALNEVLRNIEFYQLRSKLSDSLQFFLPLVWKQLKDGELIVREYDRGNPGERSYACTVNLDLDHIGKMSVVLVYQTGCVHVTCAAENKLFSQLFQEGIDELEQELLSSGFRLGHLAVHHSPAIQFKRNCAEEGFSIRL